MNRDKIAYNPLISRRQPLVYRIVFALHRPLHRKTLQSKEKYRKTTESVQRQTQTQTHCQIF